MSLSSTSSRRAARGVLPLALALTLLSGCAQEEPLDEVTPSTSAPETTGPTADDPAVASEAPTSDPAPTTDAPEDDAALTSAPGDDAAVTSAGPATTLTAVDESFTVEVPVGWEDAIDLVDAGSVQLAVKAPEQVDGFFMNVLVTQEEYVSNLTSAVEQAAEELAGDDADYEILEPAPVDGNRAPGYTITREVQGKPLVQTQRWISHDGTLYVVTVSALEEQADEAQLVLEEILESWTWQD